jgi:hypothetical protein
MSKHTPGPWKALPSETDDAGFIAQPIVSDATKGTVANVYGGTILAEPYANARLIAAAPELLQCLREIKVCFQVALLSFSPEIAKEGMELVREAEAAIAKAEG